MLDRDGHVRVADLAVRFDVSPGTVLRDLHRMERLGALHRVHGGAVGADSPDAPLTGTSRRASGAQATIARHAAGLVSPGSAVAIVAGVLAVPLARHLSGVASLTVVTNSLPASAVLTRFGRSDQSVLVTGGTRTRSGALAGPLAEAAVRQVHVDLAFLTPYGMSRQCGYTALDVDEAAVARALLCAARTKVVLADHTRWDRTGMAEIGPLSAADILVCDGRLPSDALRTLAHQIENVTIAGHGQITV
jgi:DeoR/GlpR family transcriptional regulator of sugar metabolism